MNIQFENITNFQFSNKVKLQTSEVSTNSNLSRNMSEFGDAFEKASFVSPDYSINRDESHSPEIKSTKRGAFKTQQSSNMEKYV